MKANKEKYNIFDQIPIPVYNAKEYITKHVTSVELNQMKPPSTYPATYVYNITEEQVYMSHSNNPNVWMKSKTHESSPDYAKMEFNKKYVNKIQEAKNTFEQMQEIKKGEYKYLWKETSIQTQIDTEEQSTQVLSEAREQHIQTEQVIAEISTQTKNTAVDTSTQTDSYVDLSVKERDIKLTKFVSEFCNQFSDNEEIEEFYNQFLNIMDESQLAGEHNPNVDYYE